MEGINAQLNLVLLGKTGAGKSASGNTILGQQAFISKKSLKSVSQDVVVESAKVGKQEIIIYDTPGFFNTNLTEDEIQQKYQSIFQKCASGPSAFLLVIKADRFTEEDRKTVRKIEELLGQNRLEKTWIIFTRGDELEEENMTIKEFLDGTEELKEFVEKYKLRYLVFNNKKKCTKQVNWLLNCINSAFNTIGSEIRKRCKSTKIPKDVEVEKEALVPSASSRRIVLLGKSGVGKSAAGNTILGQREFRSKMTMSSVTQKSSVKHSTVSGKSVSVVDTPGFFDTKMKPKELVTEISRSVYVSSPGPHAFLIVFPVNMRFTEHEQQIPQQIEQMFGEEVLKYSIILFTHGDLLDGEPVEKLIEENCGLRSLVQQCGGRYHVFNNRDVNNREQVEDLLQKIDSMIQQNGGGHYTNQMFKDAQECKQKEENNDDKEPGSGFWGFLSKHWHHILIGAIAGGVICAVGCAGAVYLFGQVALWKGAAVGAAVGTAGTAIALIKK